MVRKFKTKEDVKAALIKAEGGAFRQDVWEYMDAYKYVDDLLIDPDFSEFLNHYRRLASLGASTAGAGASRKTPRREPALTEVPPDRRLETLAEVIAVEFGRHPGVVAFRRDVLNGRLLGPEEVPAWIERQARQDGPATMWVKVPLPPGYEPDPGSPSLAWLNALNALPDEARQRWPEEWGTESLAYACPGDRWVHRVPVRADGVLGRLKALARSLREVWAEAQAVTFILTGQVPPIPKATIQVSFPLLAPTRIRLEVDARLSKDEVAAVYAKVRNRVFRGHDVPMTEKHLALAVFIARERGAGTWPQLLEKWNAAHPDWRYSPDDEKNFARDARLAWERVTGRKWGRTRLWELDPARLEESLQKWHAFVEDREGPAMPAGRPNREGRDE